MKSLCAPSESTRHNGDMGKGTMFLSIAFVLLPSSFALHHSLPSCYGRQQIRQLHHFSSTKSSLHVHSGERDSWEAQREEAKAALERMDALESSIRQGKSDLASLKDEILQLEHDVTRLTSELLPPEELSLEEYKADISLYYILPPSMKVALCEVLELPEAAKDWTRAPEIVSRLHEQRFTLTPLRLQDALKNVESRMSRGASRSVEQEVEEFVTQLLDGKSVDEVTRDNLVKQYLGRVTRKEGKYATEQELQVLMNVLDSSTFVPNGKPETLPGGYLIRGRNTKPSSKELLEALDAKLPSQWNCQVSFMPDFDDGTSGLAEEPVLVLLNSDFSPTTSRWILSLSTAAAFATAFLFGVGCYGANDNVAQHLQDLTEVGDFSGVNWFNGLLAQLLLPLAAIQGTHELGHLSIAWRDKIKTSPPTLLPFWILPFMGAVTQLKSSPKTLTSLFDFAFLGPFLGLCTSLVFLATGMQSTLIANPDAARYFPHLPVSVLQLSTLGGSIVDYFYGGNGMITLQSAAAGASTVPLHPLAIAGFCGIIINSLELLPLGSSDGGRMSQALFGRSTHALVGGATWFSLLVCSFLLDQQELLIGAWVVFNLAQNDMEVPCRDEVDAVNLPRSLAAFSLWFVAILAITPMGTS